MIIFMVLAIKFAKKRAGWILFIVGAVIQLLSLIGSAGTSNSTMWIIYFIILIVTGLVILLRSNNN